MSVQEVEKCRISPLKQTLVSPLFNRATAFFNGGSHPERQISLQWKNRRCPHPDSHCVERLWGQSTSWNRLGETL